MVATAGPGWRLAPCLIALVDETDGRAPGRSRKADGSIGDQAHRARTSGHNPSGGWVHAVDITHDPDGGCNTKTLVAAIVARRDERVLFVIHDGLIWRSYDKPGIPAWKAAPYTGDNPHRHHAHVEVRDGQERTSGAWWTAGPTPEPEELTMADVTAIMAKLEAIHADTVLAKDHAVLSARLLKPEDTPGRTAFDNTVASILSGVRALLDAQPGAAGGLSDKDLADALRAAADQLADR